MTLFLVLTFGISLLGYACVALIPAAHSPESLTGLPFWLIMVWGPSLAALILAWHGGQLGILMGRMVQVENVPWVVWAMLVVPVAMVIALRGLAPDAPEPIGAGTVVVMIGFNLILGPLGEELGWRGVMQDALGARHGWLVGALMVGVVWFVWHLPLWTIESPHAQIALPLFGAHVMLYAVIIGAAHQMSGGSLLPAIALHLAVNLASGLAIYAGFRAPNAWFVTSLLPYGMLALVSVAIVWVRTGDLGLGQ